MSLIMRCATGAVMTGFALSPAIAGDHHEAPEERADQAGPGFDWGAGDEAMGEHVSGLYDGTYRGEIMVSPYRDVPEQCPRNAVHTLVINDGFFGRGPDATQVRLQGLVTEDGFFTGEYVTPQGKTTPFEGNIDGDVMFGAAVWDINAAENPCTWRLKLTKVAAD